MFPGCVLEESIADKVLVRCEVLKRGVHDILNSYRNLDRENNKSTGTTKAK